MENHVVNFWAATLVSDFRLRYKLSPTCFSQINKKYGVVRYLYDNYEFYHIESNDVCISELVDMIRKEGGGEIVSN